jgi:hypothetical protein
MARPSLTDGAGTSRTFAQLDPACIASRAFALFLARGRQHGRDVEDWLQAERDLIAVPRGPVEYPAELTNS